MRRRVMMVVASAALAGSLLATDAQARGGGGHGYGGGAAHAFGGTRVGGFGAARFGGFGAGFISGIPQSAVGYAAGTSYGTRAGYGPGILRGRYSVLTASALAQAAIPDGLTGAHVSEPAQNVPVGGPSPPQTGSGLVVRVVGRDGVPTTVGMAPGSSASPPNIQNDAAREFRSGNLVRLRSGGPLMTVRNINGDQVDCFWTDFNGQINADSFPVDVLQVQ
jgi:uncharacterized protein YodC (DUF2158 family)